MLCLIGVHSSSHMTKLRILTRLSLWLVIQLTENKINMTNKKKEREKEKINLWIPIAVIRKSSSSIVLINRKETNKNKNMSAPVSGTNVAVDIIIIDF